MELSVLRSFEAMVAREVPGFEVKFKDASTLMKVLGFLVAPFNPRFATYTTTIGKTVYFPSRVTYERDPKKSLRTLAHEFVHLYDSRENRLFQLSYLFPQVLVALPLVTFFVMAWAHLWLVPLFLGGYVVSALLSRKSTTAFFVAWVATLVAVGALSILLVGWSSLLLGGVFACLVPWPAPWRTQWEMRGYTMTMAMWGWTVSLDAMVESRVRLVEKFVGSDYFFMSWSRGKITRALSDAEASIRSGALQELPPYKLVYDFLYQHGLLHR